MKEATRGVERAELVATLPAPHGLECIVYEYIAHRTAHLRERVYVTFVVGDGEFRPANILGSAAEHAPRQECLGYLMARGLLEGEHAYGKGGPLEVSFVCYSLPGSGAAQEAVSEIRDAIETLGEVATWPDGKRSWFGIRHGAAWSKLSLCGGAYRPPAGTLPYRAGPPAPPAGPSLNTSVRDHLERWGLAENYDEMMGRK